MVTGLLSTHLDAPYPSGSFGHVLVSLCYC